MVDKSAFPEALEQLGNIVEKTKVRQRSNVSTYLAGREAVPLHTDHPEANFVAWFCEVQDQQDGASVLVDGHSIINAMGTTAEHLRDVELHVPPQLPRQKMNQAKVWNGSRLYYAPWWPVMSSNCNGQYAFNMFKSLLAVGIGHRRMRLKSGEALIVDNGRWLHGRDKLPENSNRFLQRYWISCATQLDLDKAVIRST